MGDTFSIADAKNQLPRLVHQVEGGQPVRLTRRGRAVAVILSIQDYERLSANRVSFWDEFDAFRQEHDLDRLGLEPDEWLTGIRRHSEPREFSW